MEPRAACDVDEVEEEVVPGVERAEKRASVEGVVTAVRVVSDRLAFARLATSRGPHEVCVDARTFERAADAPWPVARGRGLPPLAAGCALRAVGEEAAPGRLEAVSVVALDAAGTSHGVEGDGDAEPPLVPWRWERRDAGRADDKLPHAARAGVFAQWLVATFGQEELSRGTGVLDVAGGRGAVTFRLHQELGVPATLVDPAPRAGNLTSRQRRFIKRKLRPPFQHVAASFDPCFARDHAELLDGCSAVVGLHADEATEFIVDAALARGKPFAVVPCCVFANLHPGRRTPAGQPVVTTEDFVEYLRAKVPGGGAQVADLPWEGRSRVVFWRGGDTFCSACGPEGELYVSTYQGKRGSSRAAERASTRRRVSAAAG